MTGEEEAQRSANPFFEAAPARKVLTLAGIYVAVIGSIMQSSTLSTLLPVAAAEIGGMDYYSLANTLMGVLSVGSMSLWGYLGAFGVVAGMPVALVVSAAAAGCALVCVLLLKKMDEA